MRASSVAPETSVVHVIMRDTRWLLDISRDIYRGCAPHSNEEVRRSIRVCHIIGKLTGKAVNSEKKSASVFQNDLATARSIFHNLGRFFSRIDLFTS